MSNESFSDTNQPLLDKKGEEINFLEKRLKFWLENVPEDLRRLEYQLWKFYKTDYLRFQHQSKGVKYVGKFKHVPAFTEFDQNKSWSEFQMTFLKGQERKDRLLEIIEAAKRDLPSIIETHKDKIPAEHLKMVALFGSAFYGPRQPGEEGSDIDIHFLFDTDDTSLNFEVLPSKDIEVGKLPYHLRGTGRNDSTRGERDQIHWLLHPHFPLINKLKDDELKDIMRGLVTDTSKRKAEIEQTLKEYQAMYTEGIGERFIG